VALEEGDEEEDQSAEDREAHRSVDDVPIFWRAKSVCVSRPIRAAIVAYWCIFLTVTRRRNRPIDTLDVIIAQQYAM
jgi:hypothetical protein